MYFWTYSKLMAKAVKEGIEFFGTLKSSILVILIFLGYIFAKNLNQPFEKYEKFLPILICILVISIVVYASFKVWKEERIKNEKEDTPRLRIKFEDAILGMQSYSGIAISSLTIKYLFSIYNDTDHEMTLQSIDLNAIRKPLKFEKIPIKEQSLRIFPLLISGKSSKRIEISLAYNVKELNFDQQCELLGAMNNLVIPAQVIYDNSQGEQSLELDIYLDSKVFLQSVYHNERNIFNPECKEKIKSTIMSMGRAI